MMAGCVNTVAGAGLALDAPSSRRDDRTSSSSDSRVVSVTAGTHGNRYRTVRRHNNTVNIPGRSRRLASLALFQTGQVLSPVIRKAKFLLVVIILFESQRERASKSANTPRSRIVHFQIL